MNLRFLPFPAGYFIGHFPGFQFVVPNDLPTNSLVESGQMTGVTRKNFLQDELGIAFFTSDMSVYHISLPAAATTAVEQGEEVFMDSAGNVGFTSGTPIGCIFNREGVLVNDPYVQVLMYPIVPNPTETPPETPSETPPETPPPGGG